MQRREQDHQKMEQSRRQLDLGYRARGLPMYARSLVSMLFGGKFGASMKEVRSG